MFKVCAADLGPRPFVLLLVGFVIWAPKSSVVHNGMLRAHGFKCTSPDTARRRIAPRRSMHVVR